MDFAFLPPEINSARMYCGPGSGSLLAAAGSWDSLAAELDTTAQTYESVLSGLTGSYWRGPAAQSMSATAAPYMHWLQTTAEQATQAAMQARAAAAAYELAYAMTVPPADVTANRVRLAVLVATNFFGQNTAAIAATEAEYAEYWAQDAAAMYGYAANSALATRLRPFSPPRRTTDPAGLTAQTDAVAQAVNGAGASPVTQVIAAAPTLPAQTAAAAGPSILPSDFTVLNAILAVGTSLNGMWKMEAMPAGIIQAEHDLGMLPASAIEAAPAPPLSGAPSLGGGAGLGNVTATLARAGTIGSMSVPAGWTAPAGGSVTALPGGRLPTLPGGDELAGSPTAVPGAPGLPGGTVSRASGVVPRYGVRITVMARPPAAG